MGWIAFNGVCNSDTFKFKMIHNCFSEDSLPHFYEKYNKKEKTEQEQDEVAVTRKWTDGLVTGISSLEMEKN